MKKTTKKEDNSCPHCGGTDVHSPSCPDRNMGEEPSKIKAFLQKHQDHILLTIAILIGVIVIFHYTSQGLKQKAKAQQETLNKVYEEGYNKGLMTIISDDECFARGSAATCDRIHEIVNLERGVNITNSGGQIMRLVLPK